MDINELERVINEKSMYLESLKDNPNNNTELIEKLEKEINEAKNILSTYKSTETTKDSLSNLTPIKKINPINKRLWEQTENYRNKNKVRVKSLGTAAYSSVILMSIASALLSVGIVALGIVFAK